MNKSKTLYIIVLIALIGIALVDHISQTKEDNQISVGKPVYKEVSTFQFATLIN